MTQLVATVKDWMAERQPGRTGKLIALLVIVGAALLGITTQILQSSMAATRHPTGNLVYRWQRGYYVDNGWLCYGWANGAFHCTAWWHQENGRYVSDNPTWVPNAGGSGSGGGQIASGTTHALVSQPSGSGNGTGPAASTSGLPKAFSAAGEPCQSSDQWAANISQWAVPPSCYGNIYSPNPANYVYRSGFGWCNWWPEVLHPNQPDLLWGSEYRRGSIPVPGAAVFFSGGVQGASSEGHYAEVVAVRGDGWVLISEMNFYWRGAGWQKVDYRYIHTGLGVTFIYPN